MPKQEEKFYATASWSVEDIHVARENRGLEKCSDKDTEDWLRRNEGKIKDVMIEQGWDAIDILLARGE